MLRLSHRRTATVRLVGEMTLMGKALHRDQRMTLFSPPGSPPLARSEKVRGEALNPSDYRGNYLDFEVEGVGDETLSVSIKVESSSECAIRARCNRNAGP